MTLDETAAKKAREDAAREAKKKAAQSIGEPGTQLTLRTFHVGGVASNIAAVSNITSRYDGLLEIDELRTVTCEDHEVVVGRMAEMRIIEPNTKMVLTSANIVYGSKLFKKSGEMVQKRAT